MIAAVGDDEAVDAVLDAIRAAGGTAEAADSPRASAGDIDLVVAVGERALVDVALAGPAAPVLAVECPKGSHGVTLDEAVEAADRLVTGAYSRHRSPLLSVAVDGEPRGPPGVLDVVLRTAAPARISEFSIAGDGPIARFRADGVAVATPIGSAGYARAVGGPTLDQAVPALAVVPIAVFALGTGQHVVPADPGLVLTVERDEAEVAIDVDGDARGAVPAAVPVEIAARETLETVALGGPRTETL